MNKLICSEKNRFIKESTKIFQPDALTVLMIRERSDKHVYTDKQTLMLNLMCMYVYMYICMCVCVPEKDQSP